MRTFSTRLTHNSTNCNPSGRRRPTLTQRPPAATPERSRFKPAGLTTLHQPLTAGCQVRKPNRTDSDRHQTGPSFIYICLEAAAKLSDSYKFQPAAGAEAAVRRAEQSQVERLALYGADAIAASLNRQLQRLHRASNELVVFARMSGERCQANAGCYF